MSAGVRSAATLPSRARSGGGVRSRDRVGDAVLYGLCVLASLLAIIAIVAIAYQVFSGASSAISHFGLGFLVHSTWMPNTGVFGAAVLLYGTAVSSFMALLLATPIGISIGL
jgi:phosphate transport system permease protein